MWIKALNVIGWLMLAVGLAGTLLFLFLGVLNRPLGDFEGLVALTSIMAIVLVALPAALIGLVVIVVTQPRKSGAAT